MDFLVVEYKLSKFYRDLGTDFSYEHIATGFPEEMMRHLTAARLHEVEGKGPLPAGISISGLAPGKRIWYLDSMFKPYVLYVLILDHDLPSDTTTYEEVLDLLDELMGELVDLPRARSAFMREIVRSVPSLDVEQHQELEAYARAAGM